MDKTATDSIWKQEGVRSFPAWKGEGFSDAAIVGGGITGITAAYLLARDDRKPVLLERNGVLTGDTARTSAHVTAVLDARYSTLIDQLGEENALRVAVSQRATLSTIESIVETENIACDFQRVSGFLYSENEEGLRLLEKEFAALHALGFRPRYTQKTPLPFPVKGAIEIPDQIAFHPIKYLTALLEKAVSAGARIYEHSPVVKVNHDVRCRLDLESGNLTTESTLIATHSPFNDQLILTTKVAAYRTYVLSARVKEEVPPGLYWDTCDPYRYIRTFDDGGSQSLIVGGFDHKTGKMNAEAPKELRRYVMHRFNVDSIQKEWSGQVLEPVDGLAMIGAADSSDRIWVATGFAGNGMTFGTLSAMMWQEHVNQGKNRWKDLYSPSRLPPLRRLTWYVKENKDYPLHLVADRLTTHPEVQDLKSGDGAVVRIGGHAVAAFRDDNGVLHAKSAVCPHLGCLVQWNGFERSWDCPCHGSRFSADGNVLNGPSNCPLKSLAPQTALGKQTGT